MGGSTLTTTAAAVTPTTGAPRTRVLVIEDERGLTEVLSYNLQREGYETVVAHDGQAGDEEEQSRERGHRSSFPPSGGQPPPLLSKWCLIVLPLTM